MTLDPFNTSFGGPPDAYFGGAPPYDAGPPPVQIGIGDPGMMIPVNSNPGNIGSLDPGGLSQGSSQTAGSIYDPNAGKTPIMTQEEANAAASQTIASQPAPGSGLGIGQTFPLPLPVDPLTAIGLTILLNNGHLGNTGGGAASPSDVLKVVGGIASDPVGSLSSTVNNLGSSVNQSLLGLGIIPTTNSGIDPSQVQPVNNTPPPSQNTVNQPDGGLVVAPVPVPSNPAPAVTAPSSLGIGQPQLGTTVVPIPQSSDPGIVGSLQPDPASMPTVGIAPPPNTGVEQLPPSTSVIPVQNQPAPVTTGTPGLTIGQPQTPPSSTVIPTPTPTNQPPLGSLQPDASSMPTVVPLPGSQAPGGGATPTTTTPTGGETPGTTVIPGGSGGTTTTTPTTPIVVTPTPPANPSMPNTPTPDPRNYYNEGNTSTQALQQLWQQISQLYGNASGAYGNADYANYNNIANQIGGSNANLTGVANNQTSTANTALRSGNLNDVQNLLPQALALRSQANPNLFGANGSLNAYTNAATGNLQNAQNIQNSAGNLSPEDVRNSQQAAREAWAARGLVMSPGAVGAEILNRSNLTQQRQQQAFNNTNTALGTMQGAVQTNAANQFDPFGAILGAQYGQQTNNAGSNQNLFGQAAGMSSGAYGNQFAQNAFNPYNTYSNDVYGSNFNAANAQYISGQNNAAALQGANTQSNAVLVSNFLNMLSGLRASGAFGGSCWVAREVFGDSNVRWIQFRHWMLNLAPRRFRDLYLKHGEQFAAWLKQNPAEKAAVREFMEACIASVNMEELPYAV